MSVDVPQAAPVGSPSAEAVPQAVAQTQSSRAEAFRTQIAEMKIPAPNVGRDKLFARLGGLLALAGIVLGIVGYTISHGTNSPLTQNDAQVLALIGLSCSIVGSVVFLRYSLANFLRLWLIRLIHEQRRD
jgi:uncharacterized membrane protein YeaQ/YmgE (transglycosylase-associated protein family)